MQVLGQGDRDAVHLSCLLSNTFVVPGNKTYFDKISDDI